MFSDDVAAHILQLFVSEKQQRLKKSENNLALSFKRVGKCILKSRKMIEKQVRFLTSVLQVLANARLSEATHLTRSFLDEWRVHSLLHSISAAMLLGQQ